MPKKNKKKKQILKRSTGIINCRNKFLPALCQTEKTIFFRYKTLQNYFHNRYTASLSQKIEKSPKYMISKSILQKLKSKIGLEAHFRYVHETNLCEELIIWFLGKLTLSHRKNDFSNSALRRLLHKYLIQPYILYIFVFINKRKTEKEIT